MPRKIDLITELYRRTISDITSDSVAWRAFLHSAGFQYKYPFADQVLIYAQRPLATACAEIELWNKHFGRWVNRDATGIALIEGRGEKNYLNYVFDVSDTHQRENKPFEIWQVKPEYEGDVIEALQNRFIDDDKTRYKVSDAVIAAAINLGTDNITDYLQELSFEKEGSFLEDLDDDNLRVRLLITVQASVAYAVLTRLGYDANRLVDKDSFAWVHEFNTPATVNILGSATSAISEICLREIERTVKSVEKTLQLGNRTFDGNVESRYNDGGKTENQNGNGGIIHDFDLQDRERSTDSEPGTSGADELPDWEVRTTSVDFHEGTPQGNLHDDIDRGQTEPLSPRDRRDGKNADFTEYIPDGTEPWGNGADEGRKPDEMGADDEQPAEHGRGGSANRADLSLDKSNESIKDSSLPPISDPESLIQILRHGDFLRHSKEGIVSFLSSDVGEEQKVQYVKEAYPPLQFSEFFKAGSQEHLGYRADQEGLLLYEGNFPSRKAEMRMDWAFVTQLIGALIKDGNYLDEPIAREGTTHERTSQAGQRQQAENPILSFDTDVGGTVYSNEYSSVEKRIESEYNLQLGTTVYIGKNECEILSLSADKVELFDGTLIPLELDYDVFMRRLRDNPMNNHLRKGSTEHAVEISTPNLKAETKPKQSRKRKSDEPTIESLAEELESDYARWDELLTNGGSDPTWSDGVNMNLVQGRIVANRYRLLEMCGDGEKPAILDREEPPRMSNNYMARADEIRAAAKKSLEAYKSNPTYQWCKLQVERIPAKMLKNSLIPNILSYITALEGYIKNDDLVSMRRHRNPERYMDSFDTCKREIEKLLPQIEREQMTDDTFTLLMNEGEDPDETEELDENVEKVGISQASSIWERYTQLKEQFPEHLALIRVGDFYELLEQDAVEASDTLELTLTSRSVESRATRVPMCGFPYHVLDKYLQKLLDKGYKVAIGEEDKTLPVKESSPRKDTKTDAEIARMLPDKGSDILRLYEYRFSDDRFYVDKEKGEVTWLYFNPDSTSRGQLIENIVTFKQIAELKDNMDYTVFFDKLGSEAKQYIVDSDDKAFKDAAYHYLTDEYTFRGLGSAARELLISAADEKEKAEMQKSPDRYSIRWIPFEGGITGIWDAATKRYLGGDGQIYRFAEQANAVEYLAHLQRENGIPEAVIFTTEKRNAYRPGDNLLASFNGNGEVRIVIELIDEDDIWYTMPSEPPQEAVSMERTDFERYLDKGNIKVLSDEEIAPDSAADAELAAVSRFLRAVRMEDIVLSFDMGEIVAKDGSSEWRGKDFYEFLLNECVVLDENLDPVEGISIEEESLNPIIELADKYGAVINRISTGTNSIDQYIEYLKKEVLLSSESHIPVVIAPETDEEKEISDVMLFLRKIKLKNIELSYENDEIVGKDGKHIWRGREFYKYLLNDIAKLDGEYQIPNDSKFDMDTVEAVIDHARRYGWDIDDEVQDNFKTEENTESIKTFERGNRGAEISDGERHNYRITNDEIGMGGAKEKFRKNIDAIKLLYQLEAENRLATPEEQEALAQYSGWGGLADAFDDSKDNWHLEYNELKNLLSPDEYEAANESTLTAFYTPPVVIKAMYQVLANMGFKRGNVLEPSCGIGNFMGLVPESMDAKIYGVELDSLSGRIARQLYQKNGITISGYEKTDFPDSFFDVAIGNVPFNDFKLLDKKYDKYNFLIHDYFFAKTLDKVRPGGVIAFITSSGTLDKQNPSVRKYIAQRAEFLGAIRLPNNTFNGAGAQKVVSDIIFLQKRERIVEKDEDWVHLGEDDNGIRMNQYFVDHPDMVLGEMVMRSGPYGPEPTCRAYEEEDLGEFLAEAVSNIHAEIQEVDIEELSDDTRDGILLADPTVKNFSFTIVDGKVYYRQNSVMKPVETSVTGENRIKGMIGIRDTVKALIEAQLTDFPESEIKELQSKLNRQYDEFTAKYGLINSRGNAMVFSDDNSYFLLCSLEILDENKELKAKSDMFTKRTIKPRIRIDRVDTASEALALSIGERAMVDMEYMSELTGKNEEELFADLKGVIFRNPEHGEVIGVRPYLMADEYLSGNVREKLKKARWKAEANPEFAANVEALEKVQPVDLTAAEIGVRLGTTWIPELDIQAFVYELLGTSYYTRQIIQVKYIPQTAQWFISNKTRDRGNVKATSTYGTNRINAYEIIEQTLNLKDVRIFDYVYDENGNKQAMFNKKETAIAQGKQEQIKRAFDEWIWKDPARRERLCKFYNERFNSLHPREFDGSHIKFYGMNPEITLRKHQRDAVARIMYGGNSLLAHVVGAGKSATRS